MLGMSVVELFTDVLGQMGRGSVPCLSRRKKVVCRKDGAGGVVREVEVSGNARHQRI